MNFNQSDTEQYYPTPPALVKKAQKLFKGSLHGRAILDPSCGTGELLNSFRGDAFSERYLRADACEINQERLESLKSKQEINIVGHDFLSFYPSKKYGAIIMNPPFNLGVKHLLHAWDNVAYNTEIVCILNAESLKNAYSKDRQRVNDLIEQNGSVEYLTEQFSNAERKTNVEIALIYLKKETPIKYDYLSGLDLDTYEPNFKGLQESHDLAIPNNVIENSVRAYNQARAALEYMTESNAVLYAKYAQVSGLLGGSLIESDKEKTARVNRNKEAMQKSRPEAIANSFNEELVRLKQSAWNYVLSGIGFYDQLSVKAKKEFDSQFQDVSKLEFTEQNIHGFLLGVSLNKGDMLDDMMLDLFDRFTGSHIDNRAYYKSWKSNEKHKSNAFRLKDTRVVMPLCVFSEWGDTLNWDAREKLLDIDKAMAALDGKNVDDTYGLCKAAEKDRSRGKRHDSDYFEFRTFYNGNLHLFPKRKDLIDRLNRTVGRLRQWLPEDEKEATETFWENYHSDKTAKDVEKAKVKKSTWCEYDQSALEEAIEKSLQGQKIDSTKFVNVLESIF